MLTPPESTVLERLTRWAAGDPAIRAVLLYSSRANPNAHRDIFSDYDILLAVNDIHPYHADDGWLSAFGEVLVVFKNPIGLEDGFESFGFITLYRDTTKIDYSFFPVEYLTWAAGQPRLPDALDNGYRILLDKDGLAAALPAPQYMAYLPKPPSEAEYRAVIDEFFNDAAYVARHLRRDNLFNIKLSLDHIMKFTDLRQMLEWQAGIDCGWQVRPSAYGKRLKQRIDPRTWAALERTYVGAGSEENWTALYETIELFRAVAIRVGEGLGYAYPHEQDRQMGEYLAWVRQVEM